MFQVARLERTSVTMIYSADFHNNLSSMKSSMGGPALLMDVRTILDMIPSESKVTFDITQTTDE